MSPADSGAPALFIYERNDPENAVKVWPGQAEMPVGFVQEGREYIFELRAIERPLDAELTVEREETEALRPPPELNAARWSWEPGFHAGSINIHIDLGEGRQISTRIITDPDVEKMTRADFDQMIHDILEDTFALFNLSGFSASISKGRGDEIPPLSRLEFLRSRMEDLEEAIRQVAERPIQVLQSEEQSVPLHRASSATAAELIRSFRTERIRKEPENRDRLPDQFQGYFPERIRRSTPRSALDIREHQDMKSSLKAWHQWLHMVADRLEADGDPDAPDAKYLEAQRCRRLSRRLKNLLDLPIFENVKDRTAPIRLTSIYRSVPAYRAFYQIHRDLNLGIARVTGDFLKMPLARTFELYELWCFLRLLRASAQYLANETVEIASIFSFDSRSGSVTVSAGRSEVPLGNGITLSFKRQYKEYWLTETGQGSFSRTMEPDLSLAFPSQSPAEPEDSSDASGEVEDIRSQESTSHPETLIVLDAKYRIDSGLNEAVASIHKYRDALVEDAENLPFRIVDGAYILSPQEPGDLESDWQQADMPSRLFHPKYRGKFHFGSVTLRPGMSLSEIKESLQTILEDSGAVPDT